MPKKANTTAEHIKPLNMNGLSGRMLALPASVRKKREILFISGHHTSLERIFGVAESLNKYGAVTVPDLPGFGGMDSFYKIGEKPTLDNLADYLASFIKMRYRHRRFTIAGYSLGFMVVTRMLQKYPDIAKKVDLLVSVAGFVHHDDFVFKKHNFLVFRYGASIFSNRLPATFLSKVVLNGPVIKTAYNLFEDVHSKLHDTDEQERKKRIEFEIYLWKCNDIRTYMEVSVTMLKLDLGHKHVDLPVHHVSIDNDRYFDGIRVEQHMRMVYKDFINYKASASTHSPSVVATAKDAEPFFPPALRRMLNKKP